MEKKSTPEELLRQQLELLAERSAKANVEHLAPLTLAMIEVFKLLPQNNVINITNPETPTVDSIIKTMGERIEGAFIESALSLKNED